MRRLLAVLALLALAPALAALAVFLKPELALNSRSAAWALRRFGSAYEPRWETLGFSVRGAGLTKSLSLRAAGLCARGPSFEGCLRELRLEAGLRLGLDPLVRVRRVETLVLRAGPLTVRRGSAAEERGGRPGAPAVLRGATLGSLRLAVSSAALVSPEGRTDLSLAAAASGEGPLSATATVAALPTAAPAVRRRYELTLSADSDLWRAGRLTYLEARARVRGDAVLDAQARIEPRPDGAQGRAEVTARAGRRVLSARLEGVLEGAELSARGGAEAADPEGALRRAVLRGCRLEARLSEDRRALREGALDCRLVLEPAPFAGPRGGRLRELSGPLSARTGPRGRSLEARVGTSDGHLALLEAREADGRQTARLAVERFQALAEYLKDTRFAVPAPFNVLGGSMTASAERRGSSLEYAARTALTGRRQRLHASARGAARLSGGVADAETELRLEDAALELPPFELGSVPRVTIDRRILKKDAAPAAPAGPPPDHRLRVVTEKPVLLYAQPIEEPVPVSLDLALDGRDLSGVIRVEPFTLEVFGQKGRVRHVTLTPAGPGAPLGLDGLIVTERSGTTVRIRLGGTTKSPQVSFESDPPLDRAEIVGLLLYGKPPSQLGGEEQASAGNASAAFAEGAFGLASLYLFAATPIETVGYDPATQSYRVRFRLPAGTTLAVGSDLEENRTVTFRKRLGRRFEVETEVATNREDENDVTTFLQWFMRY